LVPVVGYTSQHEGIALHQVSAAFFDRGLVFAGQRDCRRRPTHIDWSKLSERLDPASEILPARSEAGALVGNGMLGLTFYRGKQLQRTISRAI
jgi:hypothetical protein